MDAWISYIISFIAINLFLFFSKQPKHISVLLSFLAGVLLPLGAVSLFNEFSLKAIPNLITYITSYTLGYVYFNRSLVYKIAIITFSVLFCLFQAFVFSKLMINYFYYGNWNGIEFARMRSKNAITKRYKDRLMILDFWSTSCGVCFSEFPKLETLYRQSEGDTSMGILAVDVSLARDTPGMAEAMVRQRHYSFPVYVADEKIMKQFGVEYFPTVIMIENDVIIYRGDLDGAASLIGKGR
jgi:thiol-disulfide isomerase/thioredoxin